MRRGRGFTLVEILVSLVLLGFILVALVSALGTFVDSAQRVEQRMAHREELRQVPSFLRQVLSTAVAHRLTGPDGEPLQLPRGAADRIEWLGPMPANHSVGGMHYFRLRRAGERLVLDYLPYRGGDDYPDWRLAEQVTLLEPVEALGLSYQSDQEPDAWRQAWDDWQRMPLRVRVQLTQAGRYWPPLIVALDAQEGYSSITVGGGRR